ncbi:hypothetical protein L486_08079 [Kwoniella mangroviensis CBS 10435]|uniref:Uncharacterized protein n=1 Tax=Kwoniella mangroviensis CBS 10435 TaxID=1331196 RepID=A0A1B9IFV2_9TREE|nr:hypothetical protein L486_08079 [Kwoniella mangroviensis CBS 10435]
MSDREDIPNTITPDGGLETANPAADSQRTTAVLTEGTSTDPTNPALTSSTDSETLMPTALAEEATESSTTTAPSQSHAYSSLIESNTDLLQSTSTGPTEPSTLAEPITSSASSSDSSLTSIIASSQTTITSRTTEHSSSAVATDRSSTTLTSSSSSTTISASESHTDTTSPTTTTSIPPVPPPVSLFTSSSTTSSEQTFFSSTPFTESNYESSSPTTSEQHDTLEPSQLAFANLQVDSTSGQTGSSTSSSQVISIASTTPIGSNGANLKPTATDSLPVEEGSATSDGSYVTPGADSAHSNSNPDTKDGGGGKLSSVAIVGIVGGVLVGLILLYLAWYQWRKKKAREALLNICDDPMDEKFSPTMHPSRITRSSFGAADPITPYIYRQRGNRPGEVTDDDDDEDWYDPNAIDQFVPYSYDNNAGNGRRQTQYMVTTSNPHSGTDRNPFEDNLFYPSKTALPTSDGITNYTHDTEAEMEMTASLAEDMSPELLRREASQRSHNDATIENPFVPPIPNGKLGRNETVRTVRTIPAVPSDVDGMSIYESYTTSGQGTRPHSAVSAYTEPPTSNLVPWINKNNNPALSQEVERVPPVPTQMNVDMIPNMTNLEQEIRQPPRAMMNQIPSKEVPKGHGGELAEIPIPSFR